MPRITSTLAAALLTCAISAHAQPATPQGPGQSMLVLDASGSMWGQIGGKPKIEIAREAVASMLLQSGRFTFASHKGGAAM